MFWSWPQPSRRSASNHYSAEPSSWRSLRSLVRGCLGFRVTRWSNTPHAGGPWRCFMRAPNFAVTKWVWGWLRRGSGMRSRLGQCNLGRPWLRFDSSWRGYSGWVRRTPQLYQRDQLWRLRLRQLTSRFCQLRGPTVSPIAGRPLFS